MKIAVAGLLMLTSGCAPVALSSTSPAGVQVAAPAGFACPKPGTKVTFTARGAAVVAAGFDPVDPMLCRLTLSDGKPVERYANIYEVPAGQSEAVRQGLTELFPLVAGKSVRFSVYRGYYNDPTRRDRQDELWSVIGVVSLTVGGRQVNTIKVVREVDNNQSWGSNAYRWTLYFDPASDVWLRGEPELMRGDVRGLRPFMAASLTVP